MGLIITLCIGALTGWIASIAMKTNAQMGAIANIVVGIVGSFLGSWLAGMLGIAPAGGIMQFVIGFLGAVLLIFILQKTGVFKKV